MTDTNVRARSVSELVDAAFTLYRRDASGYVMVTAIASAPQLLFQLLFMRDTSDPTVMFSVVGLVLALVSVVTYALMNGVVMQVGSAAYLGSEIDVAASVRAVMPRVPALISAAILRIPLLVLGVIALFFGVFYVLARYIATEPAIVIEGKSAMDALRRSSVLTRGRKWHILLTLGLGFILYYIALIAVGVIFAFVQSQILLTIVTALVTIVAYPIIALLTMLLYYDCRIRSEGFDLEHMAGSLGVASAPMPR